MTGRDLVSELEALGLDRLVPVECTNTAHDHLDWLDPEGVELDHPRPMVCIECHAPLHYDTGAELYLHDEPELSCWLHLAQIHVGGDRLEGSTPCELAP